MDFSKKFLLYEGISYKITADGRGDDQEPNLSVFEKYSTTMKEWMPPEKFPRMLDLGAGAGDETHVFKKVGWKVTATTIGIDNIQIAKEKYKIDLITVDIHNLKWKKNTFDCAALCHVFEHSFAPLIVVGELYRVLRNGGRVYVMMPPHDKEHSKCIWHTNLVPPNQVIEQFEYWGFDCLYHKHVTGRSVWDDHEFIFEKLPERHPKFKNWDYLQHIIKRLE